MSANEKPPITDAIVARLRASGSELPRDVLETIVSDAHTDPYNDIVTDGSCYRVGYGSPTLIERASAPGRMLEHLLDRDDPLALSQLTELAEIPIDAVPSTLDHLHSALKRSCGYDLLRWGPVEDPSISLTRRNRGTAPEPRTPENLRRVEGDLHPYVSLPRGSIERRLLERLDEGEQLTCTDLRAAYGHPGWRERFDAFTTAYNALSDDGFITFVSGKDEWIAAMRSGSLAFGRQTEPPVAFYHDLALTGGAMMIGERIFEDTFRRSQLRWRIATIFVNNPEAPIYLREVQQMVHEEPNDVKRATYFALKRFSDEVEEYSKKLLLAPVEGTQRGFPAYVLTSKRAA